LETGQKYSTVFNIIKYEGDIPTISVDDTDLMLYLNPRGNSNSSTEKDLWYDHKEKHIAKLDNLFYGTTNGWLADENNIPYLKLSSGATLDLPTFTPFATDLTKVDINGQTPAYGFTIELDMEISGILNYQSDLIRCVSTTEGGMIQNGFIVTGEKAYLFNNTNHTKE
jgi:hypothetical protein